MPLEVRHAFESTNNPKHNHKYSLKPQLPTTWWWSSLLTTADGRWMGFSTRVYADLTQITSHRLLLPLWTMQKTKDKTCSKLSNQAQQPCIVYPKAWLMSRDRLRNQIALGTLNVPVGFFCMTSSLPESAICSYHGCYLEGCGRPIQRSCAVVNSEDHHQETFSFVNRSYCYFSHNRL